MVHDPRLYRPRLARWPPNTRVLTSGVDIGPMCVPSSPFHYTANRPPAGPVDLPARNCKRCPHHACAVDTVASHWQVQQMHETEPIPHGPACCCAFKGCHVSTGRTGQSGRSTFGDCRQRSIVNSTRRRLIDCYIVITVQGCSVES